MWGWGWQGPHPVAGRGLEHSTDPVIFLTALTLVCRLIQSAASIDERVGGGDAWKSPKLEVWSFRQDIFMVWFIV